MDAYDYVMIWVSPKIAQQYPTISPSPFNRHGRRAPLRRAPLQVGEPAVLFLDEPTSGLDAGR